MEGDQGDESLKAAVEADKKGVQYEVLRKLRVQIAQSGCQVL